MTSLRDVGVISSPASLVVHHDHHRRHEADRPLSSFLPFLPAGPRHPPPPTLPAPTSAPSSIVFASVCFFVSSTRVVYVVGCSSSPSPDDGGGNCVRNGVLCGGLSLSLPPPPSPCLSRVQYYDFFLQTGSLKNGLFVEIAHTYNLRLVCKPRGDAQYVTCYCLCVCMCFFFRFDLSSCAPRLSGSLCVRVVP